MDKKEQREAVKARLSALTAEEKEYYSGLILKRLLGEKEYLSADTLFVYNSFQNEVSTQAVIAAALAAGKTVAIPRITGDVMEAVTICGKTVYVPNGLGIYEPDTMSGKVINPIDIDTAVIPLIAFDRNFTRLGRGKGFYDQFLKQTQAYKIALAYSHQEYINLAKEPHDIPMDMIITEKGVLRR